MRTASILLFAAITAFAANAQEPGTDTASTDAVYACAAIEADLERLACYDGAVGRLKTAEEAGEITTVTRAEVETVQRESFGFSIPSLPSFGVRDRIERPARVDAISYAVTRIQETPHGKLIVTLENGQVWEQTDSATVPYSRKSGAESAEVKRAALGSYKMKLDGGRAFRAKRTK